MKAGANFEDQNEIARQAQLGLSPSEISDNLKIEHKVCLAFAKDATGKSYEGDSPVEVVNADARVAELEEKLAAAEERVAELEEETE